MATNLALQLQVIEPDTDLNSIMIGNSRYSDDVWDLRPFITAKSTKESQKYIRFEYISDADMKETVKQYAYYKLGKTKPKTVRDYINTSLPQFIEYCSLNGIHSFADVTLENYLNFNLWMKDEKKVALQTGFMSCHVVEEIIRIGQIKGWDVPQFHLPKTETANQLWNTNKSMRTNKTKPIPEDVFDKILYHVVHDEKDVLTKAGIIIQSQTGLRINEVLSIQEGCVKRTADGYDYMEVTLGKTEKGEPIIHKVFINDLVKDAIAELTKHTAELRKESGLKELFIVRNHGIRALNVSKWVGQRLPHFIERHDIRDNKGELYPLTSHQFRATFVRELTKRKVPIAMIMKQYSHVSIEMTAHYLTLQEEEVKEIYSDMILSPESKIAGLRAKEIKGKLDDLFHGKTEAEIDDVISGLAKTMSFNPLPTGVCLYDFRRGNCTDGDGCFFYNCPNYITEVQFYPILKDELDLLEKEMARLKELGQEPAYQVQAVKYKYLKPLVESLEVQLNGKESVG
jgi:integrase